MRDDSTSTSQASSRLTPPTAQPVNASTLNIILTLLTIKVLKRFRKRSGTVLFLSKATCVKYSLGTSLREAATMQFVAKHTSIPVPRGHCAFERGDCTYIVMDRIHGKSLSDGWFGRSEESRAKLLAQLKSYIEELRRVVAPKGTGIGSVDGGALYDMRLMGPALFGPFDSVRSFHRYLRGGLEAHTDCMSEIAELIAGQEDAENIHKMPVLHVVR